MPYSQVLLGRTPRRIYALMVLLCMSAGMNVQAKSVDLSGQWSFVHANNQFQGRIVLKQVGSQFTGVWRTDVGKVEDDDRLAGYITGDSVYMTRFIGKDLKQEYKMTVGKDGNQVFGYGDGYGCNHTDLNMWRTPQAIEVHPKHNKPGSSNFIR